MRNYDSLQKSIVDWQLNLGEQSRSAIKYYFAHKLCQLFRLSQDTFMYEDRRIKSQCNWLQLWHLHWMKQIPASVCAQVLPLIVVPILNRLQKTSVTTFTIFPLCWADLVSRRLNTFPHTDISRHTPGLESSVNPLRGCITRTPFVVSPSICPSDVFHFAAFS